MRFNKKITIFIALLALFYCISLIQDTYAKYLTSAEANTNIGIARWSVLVNTQDVVQNSDFTSTLTPTFSGNSNIAAGVLAPTTTGYFDVVIDGSQSDVSFSYTINIEEADDNTVTDFKITSYQVNGTTYTYDGPLTGNILLSSVNKSFTIRVFVTWVDGEDEEMDNVADTTASISGVANYKVTIDLIQLTN